MNYLSRIFLLFIFPLLLLPSCLEKNQKKEFVTLALEDESSMPVVKVRQIFYNIYLPTEMSRLFERSGANYNLSMLNSSDNFSRYSSPHKIALNLGLYGVDMSYTKLFDQASSTAQYFSVIQLLSEKLGIPDTCYQDILDVLKLYSYDKDSLTMVAGEIYYCADKFLKENRNESYSALIIMGGWIEAIYIACKIIESNPVNIEIMERIGEQKYSLNSLIFLLNNYQDDLYIAENILMLKQLKKSFDKIEVFYNQGSFSIDTINNIISASDYIIDISPEVTSEISSVISEIRTRIVN